MAELQAHLEGRVHLAEVDRFAASLDNLRLSRLPEAVVVARDAEDVGTVLRLANQAKVPVTVRGAGSAATGATTPIEGGWVLDLSGLKAIQIDPVRGMAMVGAGAVTGEINAEAGKLGWFYPPDPSSVQYCTIGGNIACNAGGMRCAKYGVTRDYVVALEGFLPTGEFVRWGRPLRKFSAGYNLRDLWISSEGMLGVITQATLRLVPKPAAKRVFLVAFDNDAPALQAAKALLEATLIPSILEFLDEQTVDCTEKLWGRPVFADHPNAALLLIELDGHPAAVAEDTARAMSILSSRALALREAQSDAEAEELWQVRRSCSKAMYQLAPHKLNEDVVVPPEAFEELIAFAVQIKAETGLPTPTFGHAADGNFHVHVMYNRDDATQLKIAEAAVLRIMEKVVALGGAISGEHGIGLAKTPFLRLQHNDAEIRAMQAIKQALDPNGILNPGKIFTPFPVWEHPMTKVHLPWDH